MPGKEGDHPAEVRRIQILKILLAACNAKYIHSNLAVYNLKSCSGEYSHNVVIKEYTINQIQDDILKDRILRKSFHMWISGQAVRKYLTMRWNF